MVGRLEIQGAALQGGSSEGWSKRLRASKENGGSGHE